MCGFCICLFCGWRAWALSWCFILAWAGWIGLIGAIGSVGWCLSMSVGSFDRVAGCRFFVFVFSAVGMGGFRVVSHLQWLDGVGSFAWVFLRWVGWLLGCFVFVLCQVFCICPFCGWHGWISGRITFVMAGRGRVFCMGFSTIWFDWILGRVAWLGWFCPFALVWLVGLRCLLSFGWFYLHECMAWLARFNGWVALHCCASTGLRGCDCYWVVRRCAVAWW